MEEVVGTLMAVPTPRPSGGGSRQDDEAIFLPLELSTLWGRFCFSPDTTGQIGLSPKQQWESVLI